MRRTLLALASRSLPSIWPVCAAPPEKGVEGSLETGVNSVARAKTGALDKDV